MPKFISHLCQLAKFQSLPWQLLVIESGASYPVSVWVSSSVKFVGKTWVNEGAWISLEQSWHIVGLEWILCILCSILFAFISTITNAQASPPQGSAVIPTLLPKDFALAIFSSFSLCNFLTFTLRHHPTYFYLQYCLSSSRHHWALVIMETTILLFWPATLLQALQRTVTQHSEYLNISVFKHANQKSLGFAQK